MGWTNESFQKYRLMAPGPVALHPAVKNSLSQDMIHHRTPLFDQILKNCLTQLQQVFQTQEPVYILSGTGSLGMEVALVNVLSPGDEILCIDSGKFGQRWAEMASALGYKVHSLKVPWGEAVQVSEVEKELKKNPHYKAVLCQACETSTAVLHPLQELAQLVSEFPQTLLIIDGITAVGATPLPMDLWNIDVLVAGSQKAFMLPTGLSFVSFSQKAQSRLSSAQTPRYYLDIRLERAANQKGETFFSSSVALIRALEASLKLMLTPRLESWIENIEKRSRGTRKIIKALGLELYSKSPSPSLTALKVPAGVEGQKWRDHLEQKYHITVMGGQDQLKGKILRIGHMGALDPGDFRALAGALYLSLQDLNVSLPLSESDFSELCEKEFS